MCLPSSVRQNNPTSISFFDRKVSTTAGSTCDIAEAPLHPGEELVDILREDLSSRIRSLGIQHSHTTTKISSRNFTSPEAAPVVTSESQYHFSYSASPASSPTADRAPSTIGSAIVPYSREERVSPLPFPPYSPKENVNIFDAGSPRFSQGSSSQKRERTDTKAGAISGRLTPSSAKESNCADGRKKRRRRNCLKPGKTAKQQDRHFVVHNYHDHVDDPPDKYNRLFLAGGGSCCIGVSGVISGDHLQQQQHQPQPQPQLQPQPSKGGVMNPFPFKLHEKLEEIEKDGHASVISWQPHGRCFVIHDPRKFADAVLPKYFGLTKVTSFQRQLNLYGFTRLSRGPDHGGYYHEFFLRGRQYLCHAMQRTKTKGTKFKAASSPESEPDFYAMRPVFPLQSCSKDAEVTPQSNKSAPSFSKSAVPKLVVPDQRKRSGGEGTWCRRPLPYVVPSRRLPDALLPVGAPSISKMIPATGVPLRMKDGGRGPTKTEDKDDIVRIEVAGANIVGDTCGFLPRLGCRYQDKTPPPPPTRTCTKSGGHEAANDEDAEIDPFEPIPLEPPRSSDDGSTPLSQGGHRKGGGGRTSSAGCVCTPDGVTDQIEIDPVWARMFMREVDLDVDGGDSSNGGKNGDQQLGEISDCFKAEEQHSSMAIENKLSSTSSSASSSSSLVSSSEEHHVNVPAFSFVDHKTANGERGDEYNEVSERILFSSSFGDDDDDERAAVDRFVKDMMALDDRHAAPGVTHTGDDGASSSSSVNCNNDHGCFAALADVKEIDDDFMLGEYLDVLVDTC